MCDAEFVPEAVEYTTDEDGMKRVGFIEGEEPKMSPLPQDKDQEKEDEEKAIKAMESLNLKDETQKVMVIQEARRRRMKLRMMMWTMVLTSMLLLHQRLSLFYPLHPSLFWKQNLLQREMLSLCLLQSLRPSQIVLLQPLSHLMPWRLYVVSFVVHC